MSTSTTQQKPGFTKKPGFSSLPSDEKLDFDIRARTLLVPNELQETA